jgi:hypothetical protein
LQLAGKTIAIFSDTHNQKVMCKTKTKVIISKTKDGTSAKIMGACSHCGNNHTIDIGDVRAANMVISVFKMTRESKTADDNGGTTYTYS